MRIGMKTLGILTQKKGVTLVELLIALVISGVLVTGIYQTLLSQQKTFTVQEQVVDMQQNVRATISRMMEEIRMAGFGNVSMILPVSVGNRTFANVLNPNSPSAGTLTMISAIGGPVTVTAIPASNQIIVSTLTDVQGISLFDTGDRRYISIGGLESYAISAIDTDTKTLTFNGTLKYNHVVNSTLVFGIRAITYEVVNGSGATLLRRDENLGEGPQPLADNVEAIQFEYLDVNGNPTATPSDIHIVRVRVTARTNTQDPSLKNGDGYRRRQIASNISVRNMGLTP